MAVALAQDEHAPFKEQVKERTKAVRRNKALLLLSVQETYGGRIQPSRLGADLSSNDLRTVRDAESIISFLSQMVNEVVEINRFTVQHMKWSDSWNITAKQGVTVLSDRNVLSEDIAGTLHRLMRVRHALEHHRDDVLTREPESVAWAIAGGHLVIDQYLEMYERQMKVLLSRPKLEVVETVDVETAKPQPLSTLDRTAPHHRPRGPKRDFSGPQPGGMGRVRRAPASSIDLNG